MTLPLQANLPVDDTDPNIFYSAGDWQEQIGSSRQWNSTVHITNNNGATINFSYNGQAFVLYGTTPVGSNNVIFDVSIDGGSPTTITKACGSDEQFQVDFFESPVVDFTVHTVVITNRGGAADAIFMFDNLILYSDDIIPSMATRPISTTPASTPTTSQIPSQAVPPTISTSSSVAAIASPSHRIGIVMAGVFGGLAFLLLVIVAFLMIRRRRARVPLEEDERALALKRSRNGKPLIIPQPFRLSIPHNPTSPETSGQSSKMSEKVGYPKYNTSNENRNSEPECTAGPSFSDRNSSNSLNQTPNRGFSAAAQSDSAANHDVLSHRHSAPIVHAADGAITAHTPTMSSMYMSHKHDAPPAYQPLNTEIGMSDFETRSQLYSDRTLCPPGEEK